MKVGIAYQSSVLEIGNDSHENLTGSLNISKCFMVNISFGIFSGVDNRSKLVDDVRFRNP